MNKLFVKMYFSSNNFNFSNFKIIWKNKINKIDKKLKMAVIIEHVLVENFLFNLTKIISYKWSQ